eukprot:1045389-Prymnesium_polylepis.2
MAAASFRARSGVAGLQLHLPLLAQDLHAAVAAIGDADEAGRADGDAARRVELPVACAVRAKLVQEFARRRKELQPVVLIVGDEKVAVRRERDVKRPVELARAGRRAR